MTTRTTATLADRLSLAGRTAVVTGGLGTLGHAVSVALAEAGAEVVIVDNDVARWDAQAAAFQKGAGKVAFKACDLSDAVTAADKATAIDEAVGGAAAWVNCAYPRTADWGARLDAVTPDNWSRNVDMQMNCYCLIAAAIAERMAGRGGGSIINVASIYGVVGPDFAVYDGTEMTTPAAYSAIKGGIIAFTRYLASYWGGRGVRVNAVCPGGIAAAGQPDSFVRAYAKRTPLGRLAQAEEIAAPIAFLASDAASYMTGATVMVDGGWTAI